jgi:hypothetical protein
VREISKRRFDALAGYSRTPRIIQLIEEFEWRASPDDRSLGLLARDRIDNDYSWVTLGRDKRLRYRAIEVGASLPSPAVARLALFAAMEKLSNGSDAEFYQGDERGKAVDFFATRVAEQKLHPTFKLLSQAERYLPAREIIAAMMRYHDDVDGNFIEQFQTTAFDARLWELYLFAVSVELHYARTPKIDRPDFVLAGIPGELAIEATTANPTQGVTPDPPRTETERRAYMDNYIPIKVGRALREKLKKEYWKLPHMKALPLVFAVQDFHTPGSMKMIDHAATEYVFGYRNMIEDGVLHIRRIGEHRYGTLIEKSGFFDLPGAEHVSAVAYNPQGTLLKFNRMGYLAGFGPRDLRMLKRGYCRGKEDGSGPPLVPFAHEVHAPGFEESWIEGMVVLHNPKALIPLDPEMLEGAAHKFIGSHGEMVGIVPKFHPLYSETAIVPAGASDAKLSTPEAE